MWVGFAIFTSCELSSEEALPARSPDGPAARDTVADGVRISLALRSVRPSVAEMDLLEAD